MAQTSLITASRRRNLLRAIEQINDAFDTATGHAHDGTDSAIISGSGNTLDQAYDQGGAGSGKAVTVDSGAVALTNNAANNTGVLTIEKTPVGPQSGTVFTLTVGAQATGVAFALTNLGSGNDITATNWSITQAGAATFGGAISATGNSTITGDLAITGSISFGNALTVANTLTVDELVFGVGTAPAGTSPYAVSDNTGDVTLNALTGKKVNFAVNGTDEVTISATIMDLNANAIDNAGYLILNAATAPAGTEVYLLNDNTGDATVNAVTGKTFHVAIAGTDEYNFNGTAFQLDSANNIQFLGNNGLLDSNGNEVIMVEAVGGATTYLNVKGGNAVAIQLEVLGAVDLGIIIHNDQDEEMLILTPVASAINELTILNAVTTARPVIRTTGEADIGVEFQNLAGEVTFATVSTNAPVNWLQISNSNTGNPVIFLNPGEDDIGMSFQAKNNEQMLILASTAAAINEVTITAQAAGAAPSIAATGDDAAIDLSLLAKGAGYVRIDSILDMSDNTLFGSQASGGDLLLSSTGHGTKGAVSVLNGNEGFKVGGVAIRAGTAATNLVSIFNGTNPQAGQALVNGIELYSNAGELFVADAGGTQTQLSPHDSEGFWFFNSFSAKRNATIRIHAERMLKAIATKFPGEFDQFMEELKAGDLYVH